jgi:hypothetical protein
MGRRVDTDRSRLQPKPLRVGWFIIAMVASPFLALLALIAMPPRETVPIREDTTYRDTPWWQRMP